MSATIINGSDALIDLIVRRAAEQAAEIIVARLRQEPGVGAPPYATAKNNPLGSRKAFRGAVRRGAFETFRRGRELAARWKDVEDWMFKNQRSVGPAHGAPSLEEELAMASKPRARRTAA
jgi:hypothetical protein